MPGIPKKYLMLTGVVLLSLYFVFDGLSHLSDFHKRTNAFDTKLYNIESYLLNSGVLLFHFQGFFSRFSSLIILIYGLGTLISGVCMLFFDDKKKRNIFLQILVILLIFDAFIAHNPFVEQLDSRPREFKHFMLSIMIAFSLFMVAGYRTY
jgi:hypothetical protein